MAGLALEPFERQAEAFLQARAWREWMYRAGQRPGRGLLSLYEQDFPDFTSADLWADLQAATFEDARQQRALSALLAAANLEGRTRDFAINATRFERDAEITFEDAELAWREAPARWPLPAEVSRRHALEQAWRETLRADLNPHLGRWHEALRSQLTALTGQDWLPFWSELRGIPDGQPATLAAIVLERTADLYTPSLGVYFGQLDLPLDDAWPSDADWAWRAPRFDAVFAEHQRVPLLIRVWRDLGIEFTEQTSLRLSYGDSPGVTCVPVDVPTEVHVLQRLVGGWQDYANSLRGLGMAEHLAHTDPRLRGWERWLGDSTTTRAYGRLFEGLVLDRTWLAARMDYQASDDLLIIGRLAGLYRLRRCAAMAAYEQQLWAAEPGGALAGTYEDALTAATRVRHFPEPYLLGLQQAPWATLEAVLDLRAEVFAAQVRAFLWREFDQEWWRSNRAARFIKDELWRPGRRHSAEELLGFMGFEGFDPAILVAEFEEVLRPL